MVLFWQKGWLNWCRSYVYYTGWRELVIEHRRLTDNRISWLAAVAGCQHWWYHQWPLRLNYTCKMQLCIWGHAGILLFSHKFFSFKVKASGLRECFQIPFERVYTMGYRKLQAVKEIAIYDLCSLSSCLSSLVNKSLQLLLFEVTTVNWGNYC